MYTYYWIPPTAEEKLARSVEALSHSVKAIEEQIASCTHSPSEHEIVDANVRHLELMLAKPEILERVADVSVFHAAISAGKAHIS